MHFSDTLINIKSDKLYIIIRGGWNLRRNLISKIEYYESSGQKFSHISETNITFITDLRNMTYGHYLQIPKPMIEWRLNVILAKNPEIIKKITNTSHPLIRKYSQIIDDEEI